jgi:ATP-binding cassette subfamily B protein
MEIKKKDYIIFLLNHIKKDKWLFVFGFFTMVLTSISYLIDPLILAHIIDKSVPNADLKDMFLYAFLFLGLIIISGILTYIQTIVMAKVGVKIITRIKAELFNHLLTLPISFFDKNQVGELIARVESDSEKVKQFFSQFSLMILGNILFFIGMFAVLFFKNAQLTSWLMIPIFIVGFSTMFLFKYLNRFYKTIRSSFAEVTSVLTEYIQGISLVQLYNRQKNVYKILEEKSLVKKKVEIKAALIEYSAWGILDFTMQTLFIAGILWLTSPKIFAGTMTIGTFIIFVQYTGRLVQPLVMMTENIAMIQRAFVSLQRIYSLLSENNENYFRDEKFDAVFENKIEFKNISFRYNNSDEVLKNINFSVKKGQTLALVGASGSGKSTTIGLICGFYDKYSGEILVDNVPLNQIKLQSWRNKIGLVMQDIFLFPGSITENIRIYNEDISEERVKQALKNVQAEKFVDSKNSKKNIIERGENLSVGEKQILSFARALVIDPEIIILDEATASIDAQTEAKIQKMIDKVSEQKTMIIVAHRLTSILKADQILFFDDGKIIARGTHEELLSNSPEYKNLVDLQFVSNHKKAVNEN